MHMAQPHSIKQVDLEQDQEASILAAQALEEQILSVVDLAALVVRVGSAQSSTLKTFSMHLAAQQVERGEVDEALDRFRKRSWLERISRCRRTYHSWTLRRVCRRISSSRLWCSVRHVRALA
jgi:hypothetical protein